MTLLFSHVTEQPRKMMEKAGFVKEVGEEKFCDNIDIAMKKADKICGWLK